MVWAGNQNAQRMILNDEKSRKVQILRGLAIIAVVFIHSTPTGFSQVVFRPFLNFAVGLFLFLSGMLSYPKKNSTAKRLKKVIIPYVIWSLVYTVLYNYKTPLLIPQLMLKNLLIADAAPIMYYIFVYCELTLLIPLIDKLAKSKYKYLGFVIAPLEIIIMRLIPMIIGMELNPYILIIRSVSFVGWFTYYYLGYLLGNGIIKIDFSKVKLYIAFAVAVLIQMLEGYWYFCMGDSNCGTQLKLSALLSGTIFVLIGYKFINSEKNYQFKLIKLVGDNSFGIYFLHIAIIMILNKLPLFNTIAIYPINAVIALVISVVIVVFGKKLLGKFGKYIAF